MAAEASGESKVKGFADDFRAAGLAEAADELEVFAKQEGHHGKMLKKILEEHHPELLAENGVSIWVCACCGFEYAGSLDGEPETYACPVCGQPKRVFRLQEKKGLRAAQLPKASFASAGRLPCSPPCCA